MTQPRLQDVLPESAFGGFWIRVAAYVIDLFIVLVPTLLARFAAQTVAGSGASLEFVAIYWAASTVVSLIYFGLIQAQFEGSPGKKALGLALVSESGETASLGQAIGRYLMTSVCMLAFGLGYFFVGWDRFKQGWHDKVAGTVVVRKEALDKLRAERRGTLLE